jgi:ribosomal protein S18 acetylase RimI-like enzyme
VDAGLAALIESNVARFLLEMGAVGGGSTRADAEVTWTVGGSPIGYHNAVVACDGADTARARELIGAFHDELRRRALPGSWHVTPSMRPPDLVELLLDAGFVDGGDEPAMAAQLTGDLAAEPTDMTVSVVEDATAMSEYRDVLAAGFGEGPKEADWVATVFAAIGYDGDWRHLVGTVEGTAVATASLLITPPAGGIYFVCTTPTHRRRGHGETITRHAMALVASMGATHAVLGSSPMGQRIYERLGFTTVFSYRLLEWEP